LTWKPPSATSKQTLRAIEGSRRAEPTKKASAELDTQEEKDCQHYSANCGTELVAKRLGGGCGEWTKLALVQCLWRLKAQDDQRKSFTTREFAPLKRGGNTL